jgi:hypothetical protein
MVHADLICVPQLMSGEQAPAAEIRRIRRARAIGLRLTFSHDVTVPGQPLQASGGPVR